MLSGLPEDVSSYGSQIDRLFAVIYYVGATFFIVQITLLVPLVLYRHGRPAGDYTHGNTRRDRLDHRAGDPARVPAFVSRNTWAEIKQRVPPNRFVVQVTPSIQLGARYPGPTHDSATDATHPWTTTCTCGEQDAYGILKSWTSSTASSSRPALQAVWCPAEIRRGSRRSSREVTRFTCASSRLRPIGP